MIKRVLAVIVDYNSSSDAERLTLQLASIAQNASLSFELKTVHFDNGSSPPHSYSHQQKENLVLFQASPINLGYAGALNSAIRKLASENENFDAYWFLNSDLEIEPDCIQKLVEVLNTNPRVGAVGPIVRESPRKERVWGARGRVSPLLGTTAMTDWKNSGRLPLWSYIPGCSLLVRKTSYDEVGGLPEHYKLYYEETEFCIRLQKLDWDLWVERNAVVYHKVYSFKAGIPARHFAYYFTRNNLAFWNTNFGIPIVIQLPRTLFVIFREIILPLRRAKTWDEAKDRLKYMLAGLWDGILFSRRLPLRFESRLFQ